jgi:hypothetical protein
MSSMGDLGREINERRDHPKAASGNAELAKLEARLQDFFAWARGRAHPEIRDQFAAAFSAEPLHDDVVHAIGEGRGADVRDRLPVAPAPDDAGAPPAS